MSDNEDEDLSRFAVEEDGLKPIDIGGQQPAPAEPPAETSGSEAPPPAPDTGNNPIPEADFSEHESKEDEARKQTFLSEMEETTAENVTFLQKDGYLDLIEKSPTLKTIMIGAGWDQKSPEAEPVDVDLSLFLLDKTDMTRVDEDFIFYNNEKACGGAIQHLGDSRTGAGSGDDENIFIDLNGIPFDILKVLLVFSIYDPDITGRHFGEVKNLFVRIVNKDENNELLRYKLDPEHHKSGNAMVVGTLIREGPKWIFEAAAQTTNGGLAKYATEYGIIVKELQSTENVDRDD